VPTYLITKDSFGVPIKAEIGDYKLRITHMEFIIGDAGVMIRLSGSFARKGDAYKVGIVSVDITKQVEEKLKEMLSDE